MPTIVLIAALAAAVDIALSDFSPGAASRVGGSRRVAVHEELAADSEALPAGLILYGAGASGPHALRAQLRAKGGPPPHGRARARPARPASRPGDPAPARRAAELAAGALEPSPGAAARTRARRPPPARRPHRVPRRARIAARSHQPDDIAEAADLAAAERAIDLALGIADGLAAELAAAEPTPA